MPKNLDLSNGTNPYKIFGEKEIETFLKDLLKLDNEPSKTYYYSNLGGRTFRLYTWVVSKIKFPEFIAEENF